MTQSRALIEANPDRALRLKREQLAVAANSTRRTLVGAVVLAIALAASFHSLDLLGPSSFEAACLFVAGMSAWAGMALATIRAFHARPITDAEMPDWHRKFRVLFVANGFVWGSAAFLLWVPGSPFNHVAILALCILNIANAVNDHGEDVSFVASISLGNACMTALAFSLQDSPVGVMAAVLLPIALVWFGHMALHARDRFAELVLVRLQNEDLAGTANTARDEAVAVRVLAESASNAKTAFLANMSHELRTPLNAIIGFSQIVRDELFGPLGNERYKEYLGDIESSGQHLLAIINDILDIAKLEAGKIDVRADLIEPDDFLDDAIRLARGLPYAAQVSVAAEFGHGDALILGDTRMMRQAVLNLLSNAIKHSPSGERVIVRTRIIGGVLRIEIADSGVGIPPGQLERVFEAFEQADNSYAREKQGTGLGLALVKAFVGAHAGRVWLESQVGIGTTAFVELPSAPPERARLAA